jgi:hypothetical protein
LYQQRHQVQEHPVQVVRSFLSTDSVGVRAGLAELFVRLEVRARCQANTILSACKWRYSSLINIPQWISCVGYGM